MIQSIHKTSHRRRVYARCSKGHAFSAEIYTVIEASEKKEILDNLIRDGFQLVQCPRCAELCPIAEPISINDRAHERSAVYLPQELSHRELEVRAAWYFKMTEADKKEFPAYFVNVDFLVGREALAAWRQKQTELNEPGLKEAQPGRDNLGEQIPRQGFVETRPPIHEAFADLLLSDSKPPSVPPEPELDDADDWLDGFDLSSPGGIRDASNQVTSGSDTDEPEA